MVDDKKHTSNLPLILVIGTIAIAVSVAIVSRPTTEKETAQRAEALEWQQRECAKEIVEAIGKTHNRDAAEAMVRESERGKIVCAGLEMNGIRIIK